MKNIKRLAALGLAALMTLSLTACDKASSENAPASAASTANTTAEEGHRSFTIGSWWRQYYDSTDENMDASSDWTNAQDKDGDSPEKLAENAVNRQVAQAKWDKVAELEAKYDCDFSWVNLTFAGTEESINTSILAGSPDCDIYLVNTTMALPGQANGLFVDLKTILPADHDIFTTQKVFSYLDLGDGKACIINVQGGFSNTYPLAFNVQMLEDYDLEDPRDLYARGEWTWDKFIEYCQILTDDTDGDGQVDQYGFCGFHVELLSELLRSNGASIASGANETLTSAATGECLQMMQDMFLKYKVCYPYDFEGTPSDSMRNQYNEGNIAFFPAAVWIQNANGNYPSGGQGNLEWDTAYVQWPIGPSGSKEGNLGYSPTSGNYFVIPAGVKDPLKVFNFLYDLYNWFNDDTALRDDPATVNWWYNETAKVDELKDANFEVQKYLLSRPGLELWDSLGVNFDMYGFIKGEMTPAQFQETYKQQVQDALDPLFK